MIHPGFLLVVLGAALLPLSRGRVLAMLASISSGLAVAGLQAGPPRPASALPPGFVAGEAALLASGATLAIAAAISAVRSTRSPVAVAGWAAVAGGGLGLGLTGATYVGIAPAGALLGAVVAVAGVGLLLVAGGRLAGRAEAPVGHAPASPLGLAAIAAGALLAALGAGAGSVFLGSMLAGIGGWIGRRASDPQPLPIAPILLLLLLPAWWLMATIAGPEGLAVASLADLPWSPAAERLLAPVLLVAAWALSGLWPLQREEPAVLTAPIGALLLVRVAIPAVPDGLEHWRALAMPLVVIGLWHALLTRDRAVAVAALAWVGLVTVSVAGQAGGALLLIGGLVLELADRTPSRMAGAVTILRAGAALIAGTGALLAVEGGVHTEVVYTALVAAALVAAAGRSRPAQASTASALKATAPSA